MDASLVTAIVVLCDVVGSTRLRSDLGDAAAERLVRGLDEGGSVVEQRSA